MKTFVIYHSCIALFIGFILDCMIGDPEKLPHPVRLLGRLISFLDKKLYVESFSDNRKRMAGSVLVLIVLFITGISSFFILFCAYKIHVILGICMESIVCFYCIAAKNLKDESMNVYKCLKESNIEKSRKAVSRIVGRDTQVLDETGVTKAAVETVAESLNDGVIAPLFYLFIGGGVLGLIYKAINTMDSMIGYKNDRYRYFGTFAARADDVFGFIPARIAAFAVIVSSFLLRYDSKNAFYIWKRDRHNHASPNSAQTESACAGALRIKLAGDAYYGGVLEHKPYIGDDIQNVEIDDILRANKIMYCSTILCVCVFLCMKIAILAFA